MAIRRCTVLQSDNRLRSSSFWPPMALILHAQNEKGWTPLDIALGQPDFRIPENQEVAALLGRLMEEG